MNPLAQKISDEIERLENEIIVKDKLIANLMGQGGGYVRLEDLSWDAISKLAKATADDTSTFCIGDTKQITLKDGSTIHVRIIDTHHDVDSNGNTIPLTFETVETLNEDFQMNGDWTNEGGWGKSDLRKKLNGSIFEELLPDDLKAVIVPAVKTTGIGSAKKEHILTSDKLFLLSEQEIFGRQIYSIGGEGSWYQWYKLENTPYGKRKQNGEEDLRWERSPNGSNTTYFCIVYSNGNANNDDASYSNGVSFGFCV
jgi:hypothetical protein